MSTQNLPRKPARFGTRPFHPPVIPEEFLALPPEPVDCREIPPSVEADWTGLCPLEMAVEVWARWRARPWTVPRVRDALKPLVGRQIEVRPRVRPDVPRRAIFVDVRHAPHRGWRIVLRGLTLRHLEQRTDRHFWEEYPLSWFHAVPRALHPLWFGGVFPEPASVVLCPNTKCNAAVVGRFCTACGAVARKRRDGYRGMGPLLPSVYRLWRERGLSNDAYECGCGGIVYHGGGVCCAKCGRKTRPEWLVGL